jgi:hypothetical protein
MLLAEDHLEFRAMQRLPQTDTPLLIPASILPARALSIGRNYVCDS